jgi:murein L,D-transpeptidase YafK
MPLFASLHVAYPPERLALIGLKDEKLLEVWAAGKENEYRFVKSYRILGASGTSGPKLRQGDKQVPEGIYRIESLNPNSRDHLALRIDYPNELDRQRAQQEGRTRLGGDIMIHGGKRSSGCLAMGDEAVEDLFVLAASTGITNIEVILSPVDFRRRDLPPQARQPVWAPELYADIKKTLRSFPKLAGPNL